MNSKIDSIIDTLVEGKQASRPRLQENKLYNQLQKIYSHMFEIGLHYDRGNLESDTDWFSIKFMPVGSSRQYSLTIDIDGVYTVDLKNKQLFSGNQRKLFSYLETLPKPN